MSRPVIGLSAYREPARWGVWDTSADLLPTDYARSVEAAGGVPVLLPPVAPYAAAARAVVSRLDGLVISGGADVDPARYAQDPHPANGRSRSDRDGWELALLDAARDAGLPTLGVCRGMQLMAVHSGGSLDQHVPDLVGHEQHNPGGDGYGRTVVRMAEGSRLAPLVDAVPSVACHHHQSVREHPGFTAVGWAEDGLLEAMEDPEHPFRMAVQWHPEVDTDRGLFCGLVAAANAGRARSVVRSWAARPDRGVIFDFNGTLSDDESILEEIFTGIFAEFLGWQMPAEEYRSRLLGRSDREIIELAVEAHGGGADTALTEKLLEARRDRYHQVVARSSPITSATSELVLGLAAAGIPMAVVTGAQRADVEAVLSGSPLREHLRHLVTEEDVTHGKPHPEGFLEGARLLGVEPEDVLVLEDSVPGVRAALAAGMTCIAVTGTAPSATLLDVAPAVVDRLDPSLLDDTRSS